MNLTVFCQNWEWIGAPGTPLAPPVKENETLLWQEILYKVSNLQSVTVCRGSTAKNTVIFNEQVCPYVNKTFLSTLINWQLKH